MKVYVIFPCLQYINGIRLGRFRLKSVIDEFKKEPKKTKEELVRIASFFSQRENKPLNSFTYLVIDIEETRLVPILEKIKRNLEIFRFLALDNNGRGISYEHTVPYIVTPDRTSPHDLGDKGMVYGYNISVDFDKQTFYQSYYTDLKRNPFFNLSIYSDTPHNQVDIKEYKALTRKAGDKAIRSLSWYNITYSTHLPKGPDNLLKISTAFETLLEIDRTKGKVIRLKELNKTLRNKKVKRLLPKQKEIIFNFLQEKISYQLKHKIFQISGSSKLADWFNEHLYPTGSVIRHGDEIELLPTPNTSSKRKRSLYYGKGASHDFLNNVYFGRKLYRFVFLEIHLPSSNLLKGLEVDTLEKLLEADEKRLKDLEKYIFNTKIGNLNWKDLRVCSDLGGSYSGDKKRIFILLQRLLMEVRSSFPKVWKDIKNDSKTIIDAKPEDINFEDYESFTPYYHAVIEIGSALDNRNYSYNQEKDFKLFYIKNFVSFSLHRIL